MKALEARQDEVSRVGRGHCTLFKMVVKSHCRPSADAGTQGGQAESLYKLDSVAELLPSQDMSSKVEENLKEWRCMAATSALWRLG